MRILKLIKLRLGLHKLYSHLTILNKEFLQRKNYMTIKLKVKMMIKNIFLIMNQIMIILNKINNKLKLIIIIIQIMNSFKMNT
jgi:hypothetical protein